MRRSSTRCFFVSAAALALVAAGSAAHAGTGQLAHPVGDAPAEGDLSLVTVTSSADQLQVKAKLARLTVGRTHLVATLTPVGDAGTDSEESTDPTDPADPTDPTDPADPAEVSETEPETEAPTVFVVRSVVLPGKGKGKPGQVGAVLESVDAAGEVTAVPCKNVKATLSKGRNGQSQLRVPQSCLGEAVGTPSVVVATVDADGEVIDEADPIEVTRG